MSDEIVGKSLTYVEIDVDRFRATRFETAPIASTPAGWALSVGSNTTLIGYENIELPSGRGIRVTKTSADLDSVWRWDVYRDLDIDLSPDAAQLHLQGTTPTIVHAAIRRIAPMANDFRLSTTAPTVDGGTAGAGNVAVLALVRILAEDEAALVVRHTPADETGYVLALSNNLLEIRKGNSTSYALLTSTAFTTAINTNYWMHFQAVDIESDGVLLRGKVWTGELSDEPFEWMIQTTDTTSPVRAAGSVGVRIFENGSDFAVGYFRARSLLEAVAETLRFGVAVDYLPKEIECIPSLIDASITAARLNPGKDLGERGTISATFRDHRHADLGEGFDVGTYWGKMRARGLLRRSLNLRLIRGLAGQTLAEMRTRHYTLDSVEGPTPGGTFSLVAKDVLKLADDERALAPVPSNGFLTTDITETARELTLSASGVGAQYPVEGYFALAGKEVVFGHRDAVTSALLHFDGTLNDTFTTDSAMQQRVITFFGNAIIDNSAPVAFTGASTALRCQGTDDYLELDGNSDLAFGTGDWTVEFYVRFNAAGTQTLIDWRTTEPSIAVNIARSGSNFNLQVNGANRITGSVAIALSTWYHVAVCRSGTSTRLFVNGAQDGATFSPDTFNYIVGTNRPRIGIDGTALVSDFNGWIDEIRVTKGFARYTGAFTPSPPFALSVSGSGDVIRLSQRALMETEAVAHDAGDRVQICMQIPATDPADIIHMLLTQFAGISGTLIPLEVWRTETATYLQRLYSRFIADPIGVNKLVSELCEQAGLSVWHDEVENIVRLQVIRAVPTDAFVFSQANIMAGSLRIDDQPSKQITEVFTYYGTRNPLAPSDQTDNYRSVLLTVDLEAETFTGAVMIRTVFGTWMPPLASSLADRANDLQLARFRIAPRKVGFDVLRISGTPEPKPGDGYRLLWHGNQNELGEQVSMPIQVLSVVPAADRFVVEAEEMLVIGQISDDSLARVITIDSNTLNFDLYATYVSIFGVPTDEDVANYVTLTLTIMEGVIVGSANDNPALVIDSSAWPTGFPITVNVRGRIQGHGGNGGIGSPSPGSSDGFDGGPALYTRTDIVVDLTSGDAEIWGGGGGGGGQFSANGSGGGGGAGYNPGNGGAKTGAGQDGSPGTTEAGGAGGVVVFPAGSGGGPALAGGIPTPPSTGGTGGSPGPSIDGLSFVTKVGTGDIRGAEIN